VTDRYLYVGDHGETLASELRVNNGDEVPASKVDRDADGWLIEAGRLVALTPQKLTGDALKQRAADLDIEGRTAMSADELRDAVANAESAAAQTETSDEQEA
jgi:hypothetical protein